MVEILNLPYCEEQKERYDVNCELNARIAQAFKESVNNFIQSDAVDFSMEVVPPKEKILLQEEYKDVPYAEKTLGESGCAVFCFEQGLRCRGHKIQLVPLTNEIADKGYYSFGNGTYHCLFDHYGLRRASDVEEVFAALTMGKILTALVRNSDYHEDESAVGSHFVNIVGIKDYDFIIDDSSSNTGRQKVGITKMLKAIRIAWVW